MCVVAGELAHTQGCQKGPQEGESTFLLQTVTQNQIREVTWQNPRWEREVRGTEPGWGGRAGLPHPTRGWEAGRLRTVRGLYPSRVLVRGLTVSPYPQLHTAPQACLYLAPATKRQVSLGGREPQCPAPKTWALWGGGTWLTASCLLWVFHSLHYCRCLEPAPNKSLLAKRTHLTRLLRTHPITPVLPSRTLLLCLRGTGQLVMYPCECTCPGVPHRPGPIAHGPHTHAHPHRFPLTSSLRQEQSPLPRIWCSSGSVSHTLNCPCCISALSRRLTACKAQALPRAGA